jgi:hypothetical protein
MRNASQQLVGNLVNGPTHDAGPGQGYSAPDGNSPETNAERYTEQRDELFMQMCLQAVPVLCCMWWLFVTFIGVTFWVYISGVSVYVRNWEKPCDQPLADWTLIMLLIPPIRIVIQHLRMCASEADSHRISMMLSLFSCIGYPILLILGIVWLVQAKTCEKTNPDLWGFVKIFLFYQLFQWIVFLLLGIGLARFFWFLHSYGMIETPANRAARPGLIEELENVQYNPNLFSSNPDDDLASPECCICQEDFDNQKPFKRTPCGHYFHTECLGPWLKNFSRTCPICRLDIETALEPASETAEPDL